MPGRCPSCNQTYVDESLTFCPNDGTPLVREAPPAYDPQAGMYGAQPPAPGNYPPPTQAYYPGAPQQQQGGQAPPPPPGWQQPYGQQQQQQYPPPPQYGAPVGGKSKMPLIIGLLALVLIGGGIGLYFLLKGDSSSSTTSNKTTTTTSSPAATRSPGSTTTTSTFPTPSTTTTTTTRTGGTYSEDERHKLFQAVGMTRDNALIVEVAQKLGLLDEKGQPNSSFQPFSQEHIKWASSNVAFIREHMTPDKAREYVMANK